MAKLRINGNSTDRVGKYMTWHIVDEDNKRIASLYGSGSLFMALLACEQANGDAVVTEGWTQRASNLMVAESEGPPIDA